MKEGNHGGLPLLDDRDPIGYHDPYGDEMWIAMAVVVRRMHKERALQ